MATFISEEILSEGGITGTTISGGTFFGDGSGLTNVSATFNGGTVVGDTNFTAGLSANTFVVTSVSATTVSFVATPTNNNTNTQLLVRNSTTGNVEYRDSSSIGGSTTGLVYVLANNYQLI